MSGESSRLLWTTRAHRLSRVKRKGEGAGHALTALSSPFPRLWSDVSRCGVPAAVTEQQRPGTWTVSQKEPFHP